MLSAASERQLFHTRQISCAGYLRADGLWDIEAHITDTKTHDFRTAAQTIVAPGQPVHEMRLRLTIDDDLLIRSAEAVTEHGPSPECQAINGRYAQLQGMQIGPGFLAKARQLLSGVEACTHLTELIAPLATTAMQTLSHKFKAAEQQRLALLNKAPGVKPKPQLVDSCHTFRSDGPVVAKLWPDSYTGAS